jgi:hypothetical protein
MATKTKTTLTFDNFENGCKFFYAKGSDTDTELGVIHQTIFGCTANLFLGERGAWSQQIPVGEFTYTKDAESHLRKLFNDKSLLVTFLEMYRAEQNAKLDALTLRITH